MTNDYSLLIKSNIMIARQTKPIFIVLLLLFFISCSKPIKTIVILSTNDVHGAIEAFPRLATFVESVRSADTATVLLVDAGDRWTGNPYTDLAEKRGYPIIELMNTLGYDYATIGNHEFDNGQELLDERLKETKFKVMVSNMEVGNSPYLKGLPKYFILDTIGIKIAMFGLVTNYENGHPEGKPEIFEGLSFTDPVTEASSYKSLRDSADLFIAITHIGARPDSVLAAGMPELDLIVGGHSHTVIPVGKKVSNTLITQAGANLNYVGVTTIKMQGAKILGIDNRLVRLDSIELSPKYSRMVEVYKRNPYLDQKVGSVAEDMDKTAIMNWLTDAIRTKTKTEIVFYNTGGVRLSSLNRGDIKIADIFSLEPFSSMMYTFDMTPDQIKTLIINKFNSNGKISQRIDLYPSGVTYKIVRDDSGSGTDVIFTPKLTKAKYRVALSDYVKAAYLFDLQGQGKSTETMLTDLLQENLKKHSPIKSNPKSRVEI